MVPNGIFHKSRSANGEYCADEVIGLASANDRCWHFSAVPTAASNVGYRGQTGRHMLNASSSHFDRRKHMASKRMSAALSVLKTRNFSNMFLRARRALEFSHGLDPERVISPVEILQRSGLLPY